MLIFNIKQRQQSLKKFQKGIPHVTLQMEPTSFPRYNCLHQKIFTATTLWFIIFSLNVTPYNELIILPLLRLGEFQGLFLNYTRINCMTNEADFLPAY